MSVCLGWGKGGHGKNVMVYRKKARELERAWIIVHGAVKEGISWVVRSRKRVDASGKRQYITGEPLLKKV